MSGDDELALLRRRVRQFLVHCFLYYRLDEPVISDEAFDRIARELRDLCAHHPEAPLPAVEGLEAALGPEGSGYALRTYLPDIVTAAFKLLYASANHDVDFHEFVERRGYSAELQPAQG